MFTKKNLGVFLTVTEAQNTSTAEKIPHKPGQMIFVDSGEVYYDFSTGSRLCINSGMSSSNDAIHDLGVIEYGLTDISEVDELLLMYTEPGVYQYSYSLNDSGTVTEIMIVTLVNENVDTKELKIKQLISRDDDLHRRIVTIQGSQVSASSFEEISGSVPILRM